MDVILHKLKFIFPHDFCRSNLFKVFYSTTGIKNIATVFKSLYKYKSQKSYEETFELFRGLTTTYF